MPKKGSLLYKRLIYILVFGMKKIPLVGEVIEFADGWRKIEGKLQEEQAQLQVAERIEQLEEAMHMTPQEVRLIGQEMITDARRQGHTISNEREQAIMAIAATMPAVVRERTQATLHQARHHHTAIETVFPISNQSDSVEQDRFYNSLIPTRRSCFEPKALVPNKMPAWELVQLVGMGGFGEVWQVQHPHLFDYYAVKFCLDQNSAKSLRKEVRALLELRKTLPKHPNIVELIELNLDHEPYWLAFEFVEGGTLEALMRAKLFTWQEALAILHPVIAGMAEVHKAGIIHRDLKPANILLTKNGIAKIADFGIGKVLTKTQPQSRLTQLTFVGAGSFGYMSPEQAEGKPAHSSDDVYALAVILLQMLTSSLQSPRFVHRTINGLKIPKALQTILLDCLEEPRESRIQTAGELLEKIKGIGQTTQTLRVEIKESSPPKSETPKTGQVFQDKLRDGTLAPKMIWLPPGEFMMGDNNGDSDEKPAHKVNIAYPFAMGVYQVTVGDFKKFIQTAQYKTEAEKGDGAYVWTGSTWEEKSDANWKNPYIKQDDNHPVVCISWNDAKAYYQWLSDQTGKEYRLPSEAEWEYACRAGSTGKYCFGDDEKQLKDYAWYSNNSGSKTHPVGEKKPNKFGLSDMHGNVWEWCEDEWHSDYKGAPTDGSAWMSGSSDAHLLRGGSWNDNDNNLRCADRDRNDTTDRNDSRGFRLSRM